MQSPLSRIVFAVVAVCGSWSATWADEPSYFHVRVRELKLTEGKLDDAGPAYFRFSDTRHLRPYVVLDGVGEAYWFEESNSDLERVTDRWGTIGGQVATVGSVTGRFIYPTSTDDGADSTTIVRVARFTIEASQLNADHRPRLLQAKMQHYESLRDAGLPGAAWFRHQYRQAEKEYAVHAPKNRPTTPPNVDRFRPMSDFDDTFSLFTGGRAISENLQLDRMLREAGEEKALVPLASLEGITVAEIDWKPLIAGKQPQLDPLAAYIPADQYALFFPTFQAATRLSDEADRQGTPLLQAAEPRSEDARTIQRYQRQLGLQITAVGRLLGPQVIRSVAVTGGDTYLRVGTDVALLFEAKDVASLRAMFTGQVTLNTAQEKDVKKESGQQDGVDFDAWRSDDRSVCSYVAAVGNAVVVTNSLAQLQRIIETQRGRTPSLAKLDEYLFFRDRYRRDDPSESAFLFLSDAAIRRWCGPRWRISDARRTRELAVLAELQAANVRPLVAQEAQPSPIRSEFALSAATAEADWLLTATGVRSPSLGSLTFMTPIIERPLDQVTKSEAAAYERWRSQYQSNFRWAFDPIGLRFTVADDKLAADLTIMPLIAGTEYREFIAISRGAKLKSTSGDPHDAAIHYALAINKESEQVKRAANLGSQFAPQLQANVLSWLGEAIAVFIDDSPLWDELAKQSTPREQQEFLTKNGWQIPIGVHFEVASAFKATAFLTSVRAFIEQTAPGMTQWESKQHGDVGYVKVKPSPLAVRPGDPFEKVAIYYALTAESLTLSLDENVIRRSLDRQQARNRKPGNDASGGEPAKGEAAATARTTEWLGENLCLEVREKAARILIAMSSRKVSEMQRLAWGNLPILNEWRRLFPEEDPAALHERLWGVRLVCPGGGKYVWNNDWQTMESTVYGHPAAPKSGGPIPAALSEFVSGRFGLTFEPQGLRACAELSRKK